MAALPTPYTLTLFAPRVPMTADGIRVSAHMMAYGLAHEFGRLSHVTFRAVETDKSHDLPAAGDFVLIHDYFDSWVYERLPAIRTRTRRHIIGIMEVVFDSPLIDYTFCFRPSGARHSEQIHLPCIRSLLDGSVTERSPGSILLDHGWIEEGARTDWCEKLYQWLEPLKNDRVIAQLRRSGHEGSEPPPFVRSIPEATYPSYLAQTAAFETFIVTHPGSYEHSIIDMAARGMQVLVPNPNGRSFCDPSIVADLGLRTFASEAELRQLLSSEPVSAPAASFTDMPQVVDRIDEYCQRVLTA